MNKTITRVLSIGVLGCALVAPIVAGGLGKAPAAADAGDAITPPFDSDFANNQSLEGWTVLNENEDSYVWKYDGEKGVFLHYTDNYTFPQDDWLITPALYLEEGKIYEVSFDLETKSDIERIEVFYGTEPTVKGMTKYILEPYEFKHDGTPTNYAYTISPENTGIYYIGFHAISDTYKYYIYVNNVKVGAPVSGDSPGEATNLKAIPDPAGALKVDLTFDAPTLNYLGGTLKQITSIELTRDGEVINTFDNPEPGESLSFTDYPEEGGFITYAVKGSNKSGDGPEISTRVFVGFDKPTAMTSASLERLDLQGKHKVTWEPVTEDINGLQFGENDVKYNIYSTVRDYNGKPTKGSLLYEGISGTSFETTLDEGQKFLCYAVVGVTSGGESEPAFTDEVLVGTPYNGFSESFAGIATSTAVKYSEKFSLTNGSYDEPAPQDGDGGEMRLYNYSTGTTEELITGFVDLSDLVNPAFTFYVYNNVYGYYEYPNGQKVAVSILPYGEEEWIEIYEPKAIYEHFEEGEINVWGKISASIPAQYGDKIVQFKLSVTADGDNSYCFFDNFNVGSLLDYDLSLTAISSSVKVKMGDVYKVKTTVKNIGYNVVDSYAVELYADGKLAATKDLGSLSPEKSQTVEFEVVMSPLVKESVEHYAKVVYAADMNPDNDESSVISVATVINTTLPTASDLKGEDTDDGVVLTWNRPDLENMIAMPYTESFESGTSGSTEFEGWTFVNPSNRPVSVPNSDFEVASGTYEPYFVLDVTRYSWSQDEKYTPHSGDCLLFSSNPYNSNELPDYWAITPELSGEPQTISFWAKSTSTSSYYLEGIEVYYSEGSLDPADFIMVEDSEKVEVPSEWTEYTYDLPEGARYFAIRSCSVRNAYQLLIDDVTLTPVNPTTFEIVGYNVYRNGVKLNEEPVIDLTHIDREAESSTTHQYHVTVVYKDRGESAPIEASITVGVDGVAAASALSVYTGVGNILVKGAEGMALTVVSANGAVVYSGVPSGDVTVPASAGVYIVKAGKSVIKVIVR